MNGVGGFLFPNIVAFGDRGAPGTMGDNIVGGLKATYNLLQALAVLTNPNLAVASALGHGPQPMEIADTELAGASIVDAGSVLLGGVANIGSGLAARASTSLPRALTLGRNADTGVDVYLGIRNGQAVYCGISCNLAQRGAQHGSRFVALDALTTNSITRGEARAIEQAVIVRNPGFENIRNSISPAHSWYQQAVDWGEAWLKANGF